MRKLFFIVIFIFLSGCSLLGNELDEKRCERNDDDCDSMLTEIGFATDVEIATSLLIKDSDNKSIQNPIETMCKNPMVINCSLSMNKCWCENP